MNTIIKFSQLILAVFVLSSCSQEEVPVTHDNSDRRIVFHTSLPEVTTRATEVATDLPYFIMTAFNESDTVLRDGGKFIEYIDSLQIKKSEGSVRYVSNNCIWPKPGQESDTLHFFAYYPVLNDSASLINATSVVDNNKTVGYKIEKFQVSTDIAKQVDFVTAYATGSMEENIFSGINLKFRHQLSCIEVKAKGANKSCKIEIAGVRIGGANMKGNFEFQTSDADGVWTPTAKGTSDFIFNNQSIIAVGEEPISIFGSKLKSGDDNCALVIPTTDEIRWDYSGDKNNTNQGKFISVLLRVIDNTNTSDKGKQQYPYPNTYQGSDAFDIPRVCLVVDSKGIVKDNLGELYYKDEDKKYYTDAKNNSSLKI